ncbi:uncharacterized protein RHOBADRAFT_41061 [Rhodotorula graminis WP1]|uniref:Osmotin, thaumatin-like protein n=1 Tax=Rhodotorula graminis (strain WP1) TaxID=578459 RepID=A0A194SFW9_RHOGW|nr:uncharacterized protein RHOBADRAFT_41061 [Rhodotorula graminis WP1]KPV78516.1 hypothetical protein RHOBADRAFT_41061 [Rhodotorula graminis WP1]
MRYVLLAATVLALLLGRSSAQRTIKVVNQCSYPVWPATVPFGEQKQAYEDDRGWEAKAGSSRAITVPNDWIGRIWGRHGCIANSDKTLACVTGACIDNALQCADNEFGGGATSAEIRLQSQQQQQYDAYGLTNGGGWGVPIGIKPAGKGCDAVACTPKLSTCPDDKQNDYANAKSCTPDLIEYYSYFKEACPNAQAYFQDARAGQSTVTYICKSEDAPGFTVTFCPDGDGDSAGELSSSTDGAQNGTASADASGEGAKSAGGPTASAPTTVPTGLAAATSALSIDVSSAIAEQSGVETGGPSGASSSATSAAASSSSTPASSSASSAASADDESVAPDSDTDSTTSSGLVPGLSNTMLAVIAGGVAALLIGGAVVAFCVMRRKNRAAAQQGQAATGPVGSDEEAATSKSAAGAGTGKNPAQSYNALGRRSSRVRRALLSSSEEGSSSDLSGSGSEDEKYARRGSVSSAASAASAASRRSGASRASRR